MQAVIEAISGSAQWFSGAACHGGSRASMRHCNVRDRSSLAALQVKTLRLLQYFPAPGDAATLLGLNDLLRKIIRGDAAASSSVPAARCVSQGAMHQR